jgi:deazaflavin-dependent oxidoreductase (nitroreductase family)
MRKLDVTVLAGVAATMAGCLAWRRNPRIGSGFVNRVIDPVLLERGLSGAGRSEIGTLEHVGRRSGTRRLTPVHPVPTDRGFRIIVPLGEASEWARNVLAAGHCRLQLHDVVYELDEPMLMKPAAVAGLSGIGRWISSWLGFRYLVLRSHWSEPGSLVLPMSEAIAPSESITRSAAVSSSEEAPRELVTSPS